MRLSDRIRAARHRKGWKQADLAAMLEVDRSAVGHWERGEGSSPSLARLFALAGVTGVCVEWLATGTGPMVAAGDTSTAVCLGVDESRLLRAYRQRSTRAKAALLELAESELQPPPHCDSQPTDRGMRHIAACAWSALSPRTPSNRVGRAKHAGFQPLRQ